MIVMLMAAMMPLPAVDGERRDTNSPGAQSINCPVTAVSRRLAVRPDQNECPVPQAYERSAESR